MTTNRPAARCTCGSVEFEAIGAPIMSVVCFCDDCQEGARRIEALPKAAAVRDSEGGTPYVVYRKDRVRISKGAALLKSHKLREKSATNRIVATCCNSAMVLNFDDAKHWVDIYRARLQGDVLPVQMRVFTKFRPGNDALPTDVPSYATFSLKFVARLLAARIAMLLGR